MTRIRIFTLTAVVLVLLAAVSASADIPGGKWKGDTEQNSTVYMKVKGNKVTRFSANTRMFCTNGEGFRWRMLFHDKPVKIKGRKFKFEGEGEDGSDYEFHGTFKGSKVKGTLGFHESSYNAFEQSYTFCNANDVKWSAKPR